MKQKSLFILFVLTVFFSSRAHAATNQELRLATTQEFETLNPAIMQMKASRYISYAVNRSLVTMDVRGQWACQLCVTLPSFENGLAKFVEEGGKKKVVTSWQIIPNAKWADGKPVTAKDVQFSWEVGSSPNVSVGEKEKYTRIESITIDPQDSRKFTIKYNVANYDFASSLSWVYILPEHIEKAVWEKTKTVAGDYEKQTKYTTESTNPGLYNGPYRVTEIVLGSHIILEPNPYFYGTAPKIKKVIFKLIPDTATLEANLISGTVDMVSEVGFRFNQALALDERFQKDAALGQKFDVLFKNSVTYEHIDLSLRNPILQDMRVRQALVYSIDRDKLVSALFQNKQQKALHNIHPLDPYHTDDVTQYPYDLVKAESLLDAAGWTKGADGWRYKNGQKLSIPLTTTAQDKTRELVEVYLQNEWKKVGVEVVIQNSPARVFFGEMVRKGAYPGMAMFAWVSNPDDPPRSTLHSSQIPTEANGFNGQNSNAWSNAVADKNLMSIFDEFDVNKRKELMKRVLQEYTREVPTIPLYWRADIAVTPKNLTGFEIAGHQFYSTNQVEQWDLE